MPTSFDDLIKLQGRIFDLWAQGKSPNNRDFKTAMNRLMSQVRHAGPETVAAFDTWRAEEGARRRGDRNMGKGNL